MIGTGDSSCTPDLKDAHAPDIDQEKYGVNVALIFPAIAQPNYNDTVFVNAFDKVCDTVTLSQAKPYLDVKVLTNTVSISTEAAALGYGREFTMARYLKIPIDLDVQTGRLKKNSALGQIHSTAK